MMTMMRRLATKAAAAAETGRRRAGDRVASAAGPAAAAAAAAQRTPGRPRGAPAATTATASPLALLPPATIRPFSSWSAAASAPAEVAPEVSFVTAAAAATSAAAAAAPDAAGLCPAAAPSGALPLPAEGPARYYRERLDEGAWRPDARQAVTVALLQELYDGLRKIYPKPPRRSGLTMVEHVTAAKSKQSWFRGITDMLNTSSGLPGGGPSPHGRPRGGGGGVATPHGDPSLRFPEGLYMYGGVGCGKTMLMDAFAETAPREFQVRRAHYHDFMLDVHARLRHFKGEQDPLARVGDAIAAQSRVLCLDELFVTDVADAMILGRLFGRLWDDGLVLVATSNRAPGSLYEGGLQRQLFLPFIERLQRRCRVHNMASGVDYRRLAHHARGVYFVAPDRDAALAEAFARAAVEEEKAAGEARSAARRSASASASAKAAAAPPPVLPGLGGGCPSASGAPGPVDVSVAMGRVLHVPAAAGRACMFDFDDLCGRPVAAADYLALAERFDAVALKGVPVFVGDNAASGHRFVTLVDVLYENRTRLLVSAEAPPFGLFEHVVTRQEARERREKVAGERAAAGSTSDGASCALGSRPPQVGDDDGDDALVVDEQLGFAKDRAISRLTEMQSAEYVAAHLDVLARRARGEPAVPHKNAVCA